MNFKEGNQQGVTGNSCFCEFHLLLLKNMKRTVGFPACVRYTVVELSRHMATDKKFVTRCKLYRRLNKHDGSQRI